MSAKFLLSPAELENLIDAGRCVVVDCRFDFADPSKGRADWRSGHVRGAIYANLDADLSSPIEPHTGRHPLPDPVRFARFLAAGGWSPGKILVAYDEGPNAVASRLWWLMRYFGQPAALLDGGLAAWVASGRPLEGGESRPEAAVPVALEPCDAMVVDAAAIEAALGGSAMRILDARASQRFTGEVETLDSKAGHIPGAVNRPFGANLRLDGRFKDRDALRREYEQLLEGRHNADIVHSCGSGVTACHNLFAMEWAGLAGSRLYAGSWSEWIRDVRRPIQTGS